MKFILKIALLAFALFLTFITKAMVIFEKDDNRDHAIFSEHHRNTSESVLSLLSYDFLTPKIIQLDPKLREVSGLSYNPESNTIFTHNDEKGHVYEINKTDGHIQNDFKFGESHDYEGIATVGKNIVITQNNGTLHFYDPKKNKTEIVNTLLSKKNNVEGLCLNSDGKLLLMACKGEILNEDLEKKSTKEIYAYNIAKKEVLPKPYLQITRKQLMDNMEPRFKKMSEDDFKKHKSRIKEFSPSGIAIHPLSDDIYIISARGSLLAIFNKNLELQSQIFLNKKKAPQPEGICFDDKANLYIATEGKKANGKILKYQFKSN
ncbi:MAG: SdiA-regulated domain-containing protein [Bacteroidota bacterium]